MSRALVLTASLLTACGAGPRARVVSAVDTGDFEHAYSAYEEFRATDGDDAGLLARVAGVLLREEVEGDDDGRRRAALSQLTLAGTAGDPILRDLADGPGATPARVGALSVLARRGREDARLALRALADTDEPDVLAAAILGMDPEPDRALLLSHLESTHGQVRTAAARALGPLADDPEVRRALEEAARVDPVASARAAAVRGLAGAGAEAVEILRERLSDPESSVRLAAVGALFEADREEALRALGPLLAVAPSPAGIEAARLIAQLDAEDAPPEEAEAARAFLRQALIAEDPALRSQAGVALAGLPLDARSPTEALREALAREGDATVKLSFARALWRRDQEAAREALEALLGGEGMPRVQAAALLAGEGHDGAPEVLEEVLGSDEGSLLRRTAARALAREAMRPLEVRGALHDDDALVRIYAAGGILAASAAY